LVVNPELHQLNELQHEHRISFCQQHVAGNIQGVSGGIVNILSGSMDYSE
jgi:hypothetical protein